MFIVGLITLLLQPMHVCNRQSNIKHLWGIFAGQSGQPAKLSNFHHVSFHHQQIFVKQESTFIGQSNHSLSSICSAGEESNFSSKPQMQTSIQVPPQSCVINQHLCYLVSSSRHDRKDGSAKDGLAKDGPASELALQRFASWSFWNSVKHFGRWEFLLLQQNHQLKC